MKVIQDIKTLFADENASQTKPKSNEPQRSILIAEDETMLREMYRDKFIHEGFTVILAENGKIGLEKTIKYKPDIILLDLMMPQMDGKAMLRKIREIPQFEKLPVIVLTNAGDVDSIKETVRYDDACEFLIKSNVSIDEIVSKVKLWLNAILR